MKRIEVQQIKNKKILLISLIIVIIILIIQLILSKTKIININKKTIKEMSSTTQEIELNNQINALNTEHTEYANYIQECKAKIATALTNEGVETSNEETLETMAENISKVLQARTSDATATSEDIIEGKTSYVNGKLVEGTLAKPTKVYNLGKALSYNVKTLTGLDDTTLSKLTANNFIVEILSISSSSTSDTCRRRKL